MLHAIWLTVTDCVDYRTGEPGVRYLAGLAGDTFYLSGRQLLLTLLDIPFAVSPVVAGWCICCFTALTVRWAAA